MLTKENLEQFTKKFQTDLENVTRDYCQHLFLSFLYQEPGSEKLLFKGGTALRVIFQSPRFSEDLDFTGINITHSEVDELFTNTLANIEKTGIEIEIVEAKQTTGGYLGIMEFAFPGQKVRIQIEISLRRGKALQGVRILIQSDYLPAYTLVHLPIEELVSEKLRALMRRQKPRDFFDYYFLLSGNYPEAKDKKSLTTVLRLLRQSKLNFRAELRKFLPASHALHLRDFRKILEQKILGFLGKKKPR